MSDRDEHADGIRTGRGPGDPDGLVTVDDVVGADAATSFGEHERTEALVASLGRTRVDRIATGAAPDDGVGEALAAVDAGATAVLCASDTRQLAVLRALAERGVECSTSGWDGILPGLDLLGLTTVRVPVEVAADAAVERLAALLDGDVDLPIHRRWRGELLAGRTLRPVEHA